MIWLPDDGAEESWSEVVDRETVDRNVAALNAEPR